MLLQTLNLKRNPGTYHKILSFGQHRWFETCVDFEMSMFMDPIKWQTGSSIFSLIIFVARPQCLCLLY